LHAGRWRAATLAPVTLRRCKIYRTDVSLSNGVMKREFMNLHNRRREPYEQRWPASDAVFGRLLGIKSMQDGSGKKEVE
jgi:hypothetical protein